MQAEVQAVVAPLLLKGRSILIVGGLPVLLRLSVLLRLPMLLLVARRVKLLVLILIPSSQIGVFLPSRIVGVEVWIMLRSPRKNSSSCHSRVLMVTLFLHSWTSISRMRRVRTYTTMFTLR